MATDGTVAPRHLIAVASQTEIAEPEADVPAVPRQRQTIRKRNGRPDRVARTFPL